MTKNWLEFDHKILTTTNLKVGTGPKIHTDKPKGVKMTEIQLNLTENQKYNFGQVCHVSVRCCQFFGHVHRFWSYSFSHLDSIK